MDDMGKAMDWVLRLWLCLVGLQLVFQGLAGQMRILSPEEALALFSNMPRAIP